MPELLGMRAQYELRVEWLADKRALLLDQMREHGIEMWLVVSEEFHQDPALYYVAPPLQYARRRDVMVFVDRGDDGLAAYSDYWRPTADYRRFFDPIPAARNARGIQDTPHGAAASLWERYDPATIGLAIGGNRGHDSSLTHDSYRFLADALGPVAESRFVSAAPLIEDVFDTRLPGELEPYRQLVLATDVIAQTALSNVVITPGVTRAEDIKWFFDESIAELGVGGKPWFEIHVAVQRFDPDTGEMIPYVHPSPDDLVFQRGDIIHLDCGFDYLGFASDWQKVAYILRDGEDDVPGRTEDRAPEREHRARGFRLRAPSRHDRVGGHARHRGRAGRRRLPSQPVFAPDRLPRPRPWSGDQRTQHGPVLAPGVGLPPPGRRLPFHRVQRHDRDPRIRRRHGHDPDGGRRTLDRRWVPVLPPLPDRVVPDPVNWSGPTEWGCRA